MTFAITTKKNYDLSSVETDFVNKVARVRFWPVDEAGKFTQGQIEYEHFEDMHVPDALPVPDAPTSPPDGATDADRVLYMNRKAQYDHEMQLVAKVDAHRKTALANQHWTAWLKDSRQDAVKAVDFFAKRRSI